MADTSLRRIYCFSDTYGRSKNPFTQDDADAVISTDFRSFPLEYEKREFDIYGRENVTGHIVRLIFGLHDQIFAAPHVSATEKDVFRKTITGIFINAAPRTSKENGALFYVATSNNIRVVTTDLSALSSIKEKIETLAHLPNLDNNLYGPTEQFRSSYAAYMLHQDHQLKLLKDDVSLIPDYPDDRWELAYVDRFGNMITYCKNPEKQWEKVQGVMRPDGSVKAIIGNVSQRVATGISLKDADPGSLVMYLNGDIEILRKWEEGEDSYTRLHKAAFFQFAKPEIGAKVRAIE